MDYNQRALRKPMLEKNRDKKSFRSHCIKRLKQADNIRKIKKDKEVLAKLYKIIQEERAINIMLYLPMEMEVNLYPLIVQLRKEQKNLYVPFMEGKSFRLVKYRLPLRKKRFGILEPIDSKQYRKKNIDIAIVPIVGTDCTHRRVGFGRGMYDRFFEKEQFNIKKIIFVARELCSSHDVVTDHYDVKGDMILTP